MNTLERYLHESGERLSAFATRIGRSPSTLTRALSGARNPSFKLARDVERGTDGRISAGDFITICLESQSAPALSSLPQADRAAGSAPLAEPAVAEGC